jgi:hypothetical protein
MYPYTLNIEKKGTHASDTDEEDNSIYIKVVWCVEKAR